MTYKMNSLIFGNVHGMEMGKNAATWDAIVPGARFMALQRNRMAMASGKLRNWVVLKTRGRYGMEITARAAQQEESRERTNKGDASYLDTLKIASEDQKSSSSPEPGQEDSNSTEHPEELERKTRHFEEIQQVPADERDRTQKIQVIDRAAAAIAAAKALLTENRPTQLSSPSVEYSSNSRELKSESSVPEKPSDPGSLPDEKQTQRFVSSSPQTEIHQNTTPGPDFWSWSPPAINEGENMPTLTKLQPTIPSNSLGMPVADVLEKERSSETLEIPFQSKVLAETMKSPEASVIFQGRAAPSLPPLQSLVEVETEGTLEHSVDSILPGREEISKLIFDSTVAQHASEIASVMNQGQEKHANATSGFNADGSRWWKETGVEHWSNGAICNWTLTRGVSSDGQIEWEEKFWEAYDDFDFKELGSVKSGRDAAGNVWREYWKESMWQDMKTGLVHMEKTADKWAKNGCSEQWQEKWWEHYDAAGHAEKWADKWCQIDLNTPLEAGHAHVWHERWGEKYDGNGGAMKYTDKWAERVDIENRWTKWGDKWDEHFDQNGHGVRQGETWWEGATGERWNRTWGEGHNGSGWLHKYGKSSSGEHWDTHEQQETWYERYPHFGFRHCFENSQELRRVGKREEPKI